MVAALLVAGVGWLGGSAFPASAQGDEQASRQARLRELDAELAQLRQRQSDLEAAGALNSDVLYFDVQPFVGGSGGVVPVTREAFANWLGVQVLTGQLTWERAAQLARGMGTASRERKAELDGELTRVRRRIALLEKERDALQGIVGRVAGDEFWTGEWRYEAHWIRNRPDGSQEPDSAKGTLRLSVVKGKVVGILTGFFRDRDGSDVPAGVAGTVYEAGGLNQLALRQDTQAKATPPFELSAQGGGAAWFQGTMKVPDWKIDAWLEARR